MVALSNIEENVLRLLLLGDDSNLATLREQLREATVRERHYTGAGFWATFEIPVNASRLRHTGTFRIGDVDGACRELNNGMGFLLVVQDGAIQSLEGYTYDEAWPTTFTDLKLSYRSGHLRDLGDALQDMYSQVATADSQ